MEPKAFLEIVHTAEKLKDTLRHCTTSQRRPESVAEHCWRVSLMAVLLEHDFPDADMNKVIRMCLIHDVGECFTGDIPTFQKTEADRMEEDKQLKQWLISLPTELSSELSSLFQELEAQQSVEAKICKALDQLEAVIQHNESPLDTWSENEYELNKTHGFRTAEFSKVLTRIRQEVLTETLLKTANNRK